MGTCIYNKIIFNMFLLLISALQIQGLLSIPSTSDAEGKREISHVFEGLGYSPVCVARALSSCEHSSGADCPVQKEDSLMEFMSTLKDLRHNSSASDNYRNISDSLTKISQTLQEIKRDLGATVSGLKTPVAITDLDSTLKVFEDVVNQAKNCSFFDGISKTYVDYLALLLASLQESKLPKNCADIRAMGYLNSGVRTVHPYGKSSRPVVVYCDQSIDGGGWTVFQNRDNLTIRENFYRTWNEYVNGFGDVSGEFWLGLDNIHSLMNSLQMELRVDLEDFDGVRRWAKYNSFHVGNGSTKYILKVGQYSGDGGDGLTYHNLNMFSTYDQDNDVSSENCAKVRQGAWWYNGCTASNLNGFQYVGNHSSYEDGVNWDQFHGSYYSLRKASMKIRPISI